MSTASNPTSPIAVSIVTGTLNRLSVLKEMIASLRQDASRLDYEIVVVDGGSTDGTLDWLRDERNSHDDIVLLEQGEALGAVRAFNAGFRHARGVYVMSLNDDAVIHPPVVPAAMEQLKAGFESRRVGQIAIPYSVAVNPTLPTPIACQSVHFNGVPYLYANFGMILRSLGERLGWWSDLYEHYGGDTHLSMEVWNAGYRVEPLQGDGYIEHLELDDAIRRGNWNDPQIFFDYWRQKIGTSDRLPLRSE